MSCNCTEKDNLFDIERISSFELFLEVILVAIFAELVMFLFGSLNRYIRARRAANNRPAYQVRIIHVDERDLSQ